MHRTSWNLLMTSWRCQRTSSFGKIRVTNIWTSFIVICHRFRCFEAHRLSNERYPIDLHVKLQQVSSVQQNMIGLRTELFWHVHNTVGLLQTQSTQMWLTSVFLGLFVKLWTTCFARDIPYWNYWSLHSSVLNTDLCMCFEGDEVQRMA